MCSPLSPTGRQKDPIRRTNNGLKRLNKVCAPGVSLKNTLMIRNNRAPGVSDTLKPHWRGILMQMHLSMWGRGGMCPQSNDSSDLCVVPQGAH